MWHHAYKFFYLTYETWNLKWCLTFWCNRCILTEGGMDKNHPRQNLPDKRPPDKNPRTKTPANNWERIWTMGFCPGFCTRPTKNEGGPRCVTYFRGSRDVWQSVTGGGGKNWPKIAWRTLWTAPCVLSFSFFLASFTFLSFPLFWPWCMFTRTGRLWVTGELGYVTDVGSKRNGVKREGIDIHSQHPN